MNDELRDRTVLSGHSCKDLNPPARKADGVLCTQTNFRVFVDTDESVEHETEPGPI